MEQVMLIGDIHGDTAPLYDFIMNREVKYCIQLGDFGLIWSMVPDIRENQKLDKISKKLISTNKELFVILGNHENYPRYNDFPKIIKHGAICREVRPAIYAVERGEILSINGRTFLCIGGADSIDKNWRIRYEIENGEKIWWEEERIEESDIENAMLNALERGNSVNFVLTHTPPRYFTDKLFETNIPSISEERLDKILEDIQFSMWYCAHVHTTFEIEIRGLVSTIKSLGINRIEIV